MFQPHILGLEEYGIVDQLVTGVSNVASEYHRQLLENTMLCGGTASMIGTLFLLKSFQLSPLVVVFSYSFLTLFS